MRPELASAVLTQRRGGPRHGARLLLGGTDAGLLVIGVEPMADEPLDAPAPRVPQLVHQLQATLAATLADALGWHAAQAVLLIHELRAGGDMRGEVATGLATEIFLQTLVPGELELERSGRPDAWITEPFFVRAEPGDPPDALAVFVAKLLSWG
jgi:hypothetical protein